MALFSGNKDTPQQQQQARVEAAVDEATDYLNGMAGEGLSEMDASTITTAYLAMAQPRGGAVTAGTMDAGDFYNTGTGTIYGKTVKVIPVGFKVIWNERDSLGMTVARYEPKSIHVDIQPVPRGKKGYPKMINPDSGNEVVETYMYALVFPDHPEDGWAIYIPTKSSIKACRKWNTMLRSSRLPNGAQSPIFGYSWYMALERVDEGKPTDHVKISTVVRGDLVQKPLFLQVVEPAKQIELKPQLALGAPEEDDSAVVETTEY
jgi:hypothetical protein